MSVTPARLRGRVGRPPGGDGDETRQRILISARSCFATHGYAATTNRMIAAAAELTSAAVYHHFGKKSDLMLAVHRATEELYRARIRSALDAVDGFVEKVAALLDVIHETMRDDPEQVIFFSVANDEARRHPELGPILAERAFTDIFVDLVEIGVATGELARDDALSARGAIAAVATGLAMMARDLTPEAHALATEGCKRMLLGDLVAVASPR